MKTLIFPDIHLKQAKVDPIVDQENPDRVVLLGDIFDDYHDSRAMNRKAAIWLKTCGYDWVYGNHDVHYMYPRNDWVRCTGFTKGKADEINLIMLPEDWFRGNFFTMVGDWLCTHAGLHRRFLHRLVTNVDELKEWLTAEQREARRALERGGHHWFAVPGEARGGMEEIGGITWCDFHLEFDPIPWLNQVFGHTNMTVDNFYEPGIIKDVQGSPHFSVDLDVNLRHYMVMEDEKWQIKKLT